MTMDIAWLMELTLEHARLFKLTKYGYFMDREKCFDKFPWDVLYQL